MATQDEQDDIMANQLDAMQRELDGLELENRVYEEYLNRADAEAVGSAEATPAPGERERHRIAAGGRSGRSGRTRLPQRLTIEQKCEISNGQLDQQKKEMEEAKKSSERLVDTLKAVLEETDMRIGELKKDAYEFKRDIVVGAENMRTGRTMAEKVQKYMEEKLKNRDSMIDKLKLKNVTIKAQINKVEAQLKQKEEMGDVLHYIDFHQLQIENKQYLAKIDERNDELLKLKMTTGAAVQTLNNQKEKLAKLQEEAEFLRREIKTRTEILRKLRDDTGAVTAEIASEKRTKRRLGQQQAESSEMPQILDYVGQKAEFLDLEQALENWERKLELMEMAAKRARSVRRMHARTSK
jgi:chromosome segregation ATPase